MVWPQTDPESVLTELAGSVSVPILFLSLSVGSHPCSGSHGILGSVGSS